MKICPYCGAQLQENAAFCLYCMKSLEEKKPFLSKKKKSKGLITAVILLCAALVTSGAFLLFSAREDTEKPKETVKESTPKDTTPKESTPKESAPKESTAKESTAKEADDPLTEEWPQITSFERFQEVAIALTDRDEELCDLWSPEKFLNITFYKDRTNDRVDVYSTKINIENARLTVHFCEKGQEITSLITGLNDESYDKGIMLSEALICSVYNQTFVDLHDALTDSYLYQPTEVTTDDIILSDEKDYYPTRDEYDKGTTPKVTTNTLIMSDNKTQVMCFQTVERIYRGERLYDFIIFHTQDVEGKLEK